MPPVNHVIVMANGMMLRQYAQTSVTVIPTIIYAINDNGVIRNLSPSPADDKRLRV